MRKPDTCKVCERKLMGHNKGTTILYGSNYCSKYCKIFDTDNLQMINAAEKHGKKQLRGFNYWPKITLSCDVCNEDVTLSHAQGTDDKLFCSRECNFKLKTCRKNAMKDYTILRILREQPCGLDTEEVSYILGSMHNYRTKPLKITHTLRKWVSKGIVVKENPQKKGGVIIYRISSEHLGQPLGAIVIKHLTPRGYADVQNSN